MGTDRLPPDLRPPARPGKQPPSGDGDPAPDPWAIVSTLLAGPLVWGAAGWVGDRWLGTDPALTVLGILIGAVTAFYIVYVRFGRE
ncbi:MAG: AtpZ/AtpI family protein [Candidatus Nanopelagicales bacterium]